MLSTFIGVGNMENRKLTLLVTRIYLFIIVCTGYTYLLICK